MLGISECRYFLILYGNPTYVDVDTLLQRGFFLWDCEMLGGADMKKTPFLCVGIRKIAQLGMIAMKCHKARYLSFMLFPEIEQPTPLATAAAADALLGLRCLAWLAPLS